MHRATNSTWLVRGGVFLLLVVTALPMLALVNVGQKVTKPIELPAYTKSFFELASYIRKLPEEAVIFGTGWWQSPGLALYSGKKFYNFQHWMPDEINRRNNKYLVFDPYTLGIANSDVVSALALNDTREIFKATGGELYQINKANYYAPLEVKTSDLAKLKSKIDFSQGDYDFKRGFYPIENNQYAWMRTDGLVVLARTNEHRLVISLVVPQQLIKEKPVSLRVEVPGCANETFNLHQPWENSVEVKLDCQANRDRTPLYLYMHFSRPLPFVHQIDAENRLLTALVRSVKLID
jgi:hypothetical protein